MPSKLFCRLADFYAVVKMKKKKLHCKAIQELLFPNMKQIRVFSFFPFQSTKRVDGTGVPENNTWFFDVKFIKKDILPTLTKTGLSRDTFIFGP